MCLNKAQYEDRSARRQETFHHSCGPEQNRRYLVQTKIKESALQLWWRCYRVQFVRMFNLDCFLGRQPTRLTVPGAGLTSLDSNFNFLTRRTFDSFQQELNTATKFSHQLIWEHDNIEIKLHKVIQSYKCFTFCLSPCQKQEFCGQEQHFSTQLFRISFSETSFCRFILIWPFESCSLSINHMNGYRNASNRLEQIKSSYQVSQHPALSLTAAPCAVDSVYWSLYLLPDVQLVFYSCLVSFLCTRRDELWNYLCVKAVRCCLPAVVFHTRVQSERSFISTDASWYQTHFCVRSGEKKVFWTSAGGPARIMHRLSSVSLHDVFPS